MKPRDERDSELLAAEVRADRAAESQRETKRQRQEQRKLDGSQRRAAGRAPRAWVLEQGDGLVLTIRPMGFLWALALPLLTVGLPVSGVFALAWWAFAGTSMGYMFAFYYVIGVGIVVKMVFNRFALVRIFVSSKGHYVVYRRNARAPLTGPKLQGDKVRARGPVEELMLDIRAYFPTPHAVYKRVEILTDTERWSYRWMDIKGLAPNDISAIKRFKSRFGIRG